jgi:uracil-DNA glycosylase family 4
MTLDILRSQIETCKRCPRLVTYRADVAAAKRKAFADWDYWGKPVAGFGDPRARLWIIGLAPAAHGANRTGRVFTGDRSGDFLFAALYRARLASQQKSLHRNDGLTLRDCFISATARCAPPDNKPLPDEVANCASYLDHEWSLLNDKRVILALGGIAWNAAIALAGRNGIEVARPRPGFGHGVEVRLSDRVTLVGSYHVSQQNTFTGRLTETMFDAVIRRCIEITESPLAASQTTPPGLRSRKRRTSSI